VLHVCIAIRLHTSTQAYGRVECNERLQTFFKYFFERSVTAKAYSDYNRANVLRHGKRLNMGVEMENKTSNCGI